MKKLLSAVVFLIGFAGLVVLGEDDGGDGSQKQERQVKSGDTGIGTMTGTIEKIEDRFNGSKVLTVKDGDRSIVIWPKYADGNPVRELMEKVGNLKVGDKVKVGWVTDNDRLRINSIEKIEKAD